jgi:hypothetical protein
MEPKMLKFRSEFRFVAIAVAFVLCLLSGKAQTARNTMFQKRFSDTIMKVRTGGTTNIQVDAAKQLYVMTRGRDNKDLDDKTIADLVSLLDHHMGLHWVAMCLGNIGPRAKMAIPKLQEKLAVEDCYRVDFSAASALRFALRQMGVTPPPPFCQHPFPFGYYPH